jgi:hypothetical protein
MKNNTDVRAGANVIVQHGAVSINEAGDNNQANTAFGSGSHRLALRLPAG